MHPLEIYDVVPIPECMRATGRKPLSGRWFDHNEGLGDEPDIRSRYFAKDYNKGRAEGLFAATPPLEPQRGTLVFVNANCTQMTWFPGGVDGSAARRPPCDRATLVSPPPLEPTPRQPRKSGAGGRDTASTSNHDSYILS